LKQELLKLYFLFGSFGDLSQGKEILTINHQKSQIENTTSAVLASRPNANDIKSMENLVNGLNGSSSSKFGISHSEVGGEVSTS
jgi:hypothetical protein